jgi:hypothetical protein
MNIKLNQHIGCKLDKRGKSFLLILYYRKFIKYIAFNSFKTFALHFVPKFIKTYYIKKAYKRLGI